MHASTRREKAASALLGFLFALFTLIGRKLQAFGTVEKFFSLHLLSQTLVQLFSLWSFFAFCILLLLSASVLLDGSVSALRFQPPFWVLWLLIFICWLPYFTAFYPACLSDDSIWELDIALQQKTLCDHHPIIHIFTIQLFVRLGQLMGSVSLGVGLYTLFQMLVMSAIFAGVVCFLRSHGVPTAIQLCVLLFYALLSIHAFYSISMWKDVFFAGMTALLMMILLHLSARPAHACSLRCCVLLGCVLFLFCTYRHNGYYVFLAAFPIYLLLNRCIWKKLLPVGLCALLLVNAYQALIFDGLHAVPSASGEKLSVPMQQLARAATLHPDEFTSEEATLIAEIFPSLESLASLYDPNISDPVKASFRSEVFDQNPARYARLWLQVGLRHPLVYVDAFLNQCYGYWYPDVSRWSVYMLIEPNAYNLAHRPSQLIAALVSLHYAFQDHLPFSFLFRPGTYTWCLLFAALLLFTRGRYRLLSPMVFLLFLFFTTLLSPVHAEFRYVYGLVVSAPLFLGLAFSSGHADER